MFTAPLTLALILPLTWQFIPILKPASLRGVAVSPDGVFCVAGSGPTVWVSRDQGEKWSERTPEQENAKDYRCVAMPDSNSILIASAGSPALILRSEDLGRHWKVVHSDERPAAFIDGMRFWNSRQGIAFGDPVGGKFLLLKTNDGGRTWREIDSGIKPLDGEAGFAASNGSMDLSDESTITIGLGAQTNQIASRVIKSNDSGNTWSVSDIECIASGNSSGIFALTMRPSGFGIAIGGDYRLTDLAKNHIAVTEDHGRTWRLPKGNPPGGFRSSVIFVPGKNGGFWLTTGPSGTDISPDGEVWRALSKEGFHALSLTSDSVPIAAGSDGRVALLRER